MGNIMYIASVTLIVLALAGALSLININSYFAENSTNENGTQTIDPHNDIKILNEQMTKSNSGNYIINGRAQNKGQYKLRYVSITVNFYDKYGHLLYSSFDAKSYINPDEIWNFEVPYRKSATPYSYSVKVGPTILK
ncbi:FxLYD domain-containing protein [Methanobacterium sp.]|uniref:FxLYD domain-containing protein n=1 Tax=Methanobacterium sp. TaxID=2164 RepID=UPI003C7633A9